MLHSSCPRIHVRASDVRRLSIILRGRGFNLIFYRFERFEHNIKVTFISGQTNSAARCYSSSCSFSEFKQSRQSSPISYTQQADVCSCQSIVASPVPAPAYFPSGSMSSVAARGSRSIAQNPRTHPPLLQQPTGLA